MRQKKQLHILRLKMLYYLFRFHMAAKMDFTGVLHYSRFPYAAVIKPVVRQFHLLPVHDLLTEDPVDAQSLKSSIDATGYTCLEVSSEPYEKKGWLFRK